jgi:hypothetical protein
MADASSPEFKGHARPSLARRVYGPFVVFLVIAGAIAVLIFLTERHKTVTVRNDTGSGVRIAACNDGGQDVNAGESFTAEGVPSHGLLFCLITPERGTGRSRCVAVPQTTSPVALSELRIVGTSRCK